MRSKNKCKQSASWINIGSSLLFSGFRGFGTDESSNQSRARILKHFKVAAEKITLGKVDFSSEILKQHTILLTAPRSSHPSRKTAWMIKNPEKAGMDRKISFHAKSCLFSPHEMFKNSGSGNKIYKSASVIEKCSHGVGNQILLFYPELLGTFVITS
jgi:hypothetical protein